MSQTGTIDLSRYRQREYTGPVFDVVTTCQEAPLTLLKFVCIYVFATAAILWALSFSDISGIQLWGTGIVLVVMSIFISICHTWSSLIKEISRNLEGVFLMVLNLYQDISLELKKAGKTGIDKKTLLKEVVFQVFLPGITSTIRNRIPVLHYPLNYTIRTLIKQVTNRIPPDDIPDGVFTEETPESAERVKRGIRSFFRKSSGWLLIPVNIAFFFSIMGYLIFLMSAIITVLLL